MREVPVDIIEINEILVKLIELAKKNNSSVQQETVKVFNYIYNNYKGI